MNIQTGFDTLGFVKRLSAAGMEPRLAEALAEALNDGVFDTLATKSDLRELELRLANALKELELRLMNTLKESELRATGRMGAMIAGSTALTVAVLGALIALN